MSKLGWSGFKMIVALALSGTIISCTTTQTKLSPPVLEINLTRSVTIASGGAPLSKLGDRYWIITSPFVYRIFETKHTITIPKGFVTDLASVPRALWSLGLAPHDSYMTAAIVHDYLYWDQRCSKAEADSVLKLAMYESKVGGVRSWFVYTGVAWFGSGSFSENAKRKQGGERRLLTSAYADQIIAADVTSETTLLSVLRNANPGDTLAVDASNRDIREFCQVAVAELSKL